MTPCWPPPNERPWFMWCSYQWRARPERDQWHPCTKGHVEQCQGNAPRWGLHLEGHWWVKVCLLDGKTNRRCNMGLPYWPGRDHTAAVCPCS